MTTAIPTELAPSRTSLMTAYGRGIHRFEHAGPWVHDDPFALSLIGPGWRDLQAHLRQVFPPDVERPATATVLCRTRYVEDRLLDGRFGRYVLLGAGLDTFAWRRPDLLGKISVIEVDRPGPQAWKRSRMAELGLPEHRDHHFMPADFNDLAGAGPAAIGGSATTRTLYNWLGVTMYLSQEAIEATLAVVARSAPGSEIVVSYAVPDKFLDAPSKRFTDAITVVAAAGGEPILSRPSPEEMEAIARRCGLEVAEHPSHAELVDCYFAGREDGLRPLLSERVIALRVP